MPSYTTVGGDTFETVSRKVYGEESQASKIQAANPGVEEPFASGLVLAVPTTPASLAAINAANSNNPNEVSLLINDKRFTFWESVTITRSIDTVDAITFSAPFEAGSAEFRETFRPFSYPSAVFVVGNERLFSGVILEISPQLVADKRSVGVSGYSLPGVLFDCTASPSAAPPSFTNQKLSSIAAQLCAPFGVSVSLDGDDGATFPTAALEIGKTVGEFLANLAKERGVVLSSTQEGRLLIWPSVEPGNPVAVLRQGASPVVSVKAQFKPQSYFTSISGTDPVAVGNKGSVYTARNQFAEGLFRPYTFEAKNTENGSVKKAVEAKIGRMFGECASYTLAVSTWRDPSGALWAPNKTLVLNAPGAMIYKDYEFLIRSVTYEKTPDSETAELELVLPGAYNGKQPDTLPWL